MSSRVKEGDKFTVRIEKIVPKGSGIGFAEGVTFFVSLAAPGDVVRVRVNQAKGNTAFAEIEEILEPSPERIAPPCPYFGTCGGCNFQQLKYRSQLDAKVGIIRDCLHRIGKIDYEGHIPIVASPREFDYRLRAQWHLDTGTRRIGYFRRASHDVIDVVHCPIITPELEKALDHLRATVDWPGISGHRIEVEAAHGSESSISMYSKDVPWPVSEIGFQANGEEYTFSAQTFFQGNKYLIGPLIDAAVGGLSGERALDLFCGVGLFALPLARSFGQVVGVESNDLAIDFAEKNASRAELSNIEFRREGVETFLKRQHVGRPDAVVFDPPRAGTSKDTILRMIGLIPETISYVSCEPSILARDLRWMLDAGYDIRSITALDLFPQTHHVETVARLSRISQ